MKKIILFSLLSFIATYSSPQAVNLDSVYYNEELVEHLKSHVIKLTSKKLLGRSTLTGHDRMASLFIDSLFHSFKLEPYLKSPHISNFQDFNILSRTPSTRQLFYNGFKYSYNTDFICLGPDPEINKEYELVFGGFGERDEIDSLDLKGKAMFILVNNLRVGGMKVQEMAVEKGCSLIILANYNLPNQFETISQQLGKEHSTTRFNLAQSTPMGASRFFAKFGKPIPQILISDQLANRLLGGKPQEIAKRVEQKNHEQPFAPHLKIGFVFNYNIDTIKTNNVIGYIPARTNTQQSIIVCAHFDHLAADDYNWYPGADDNASGTSVLIELARNFSSQYSGNNLPLRNIVFAAFTAEEIGLLGSMHYSKNPIFSLDSTTLVINLDMLGRESKKFPDERLLFIDGKNRNDEFIAILNTFNNSGEFKIDTKGLDDVSLFSVSDHHHFQQKGIPSFLFNTGIHNDYHQPTDTADKLRYRNMASIFDLLFKTIDLFANQNNPWGKPNLQK